MRDERTTLVPVERSPAGDCGVCGIRARRLVIVSTRDGVPQGMKLVCLHCDPEYLATVSSVDDARRPGATQEVVPPAHRDAA